MSNFHTLTTAKQIHKLTELLAPMGIDFRKFLKKLRSYARHNKHRINAEFNIPTDHVSNRMMVYKRYLRHRLRRLHYAYFVDATLGAKYKIVCLQDSIRATPLLEAFMSAFIEGDESIMPFMNVCEKFHKSKIMKRTKFTYQLRHDKMKKIIKFYSLPQEWWKKYTDLKSDDLD